MEDIILVENNNLYNLLNKEIKCEHDSSVEVKVERIIYESDEEFSNNLVNFDIYKDHVVKEELIVGPEVIETKEYTNDEELKAITEKSLPETTQSNVKSKKKSSKKKYNVANTKKCTSMTSYNCKQCDKTFPSNQARSKHYKACHFTNSCPACGKVIMHMGNLNRHLREVCKVVKANGKEKEKSIPRNMFICDICKNSFTHKGSLTTHIRNHLGISKLYKCDLCNKKYNKRHNLKCHFFAAHTANYLYRCRFCVREFNWQYALKCHEKKVHGKSKVAKKKS